VQLKQSLLVLAALLKRQTAMEMLVETQPLAHLYLLMVVVVVVLALVAPPEVAAVVNYPLAQLVLLVDQPCREDHMLW
jgi:hypothetical protein